MTNDNDVRIQFKAEGADEVAASIRSISKALRKLNRRAKKAAKTLARLRRLQVLLDAGKSAR
jgi:hypothetical protein